MGANYSSQQVESLTRVTNNILNRTINRVENSGEGRGRSFQSMDIDLRGADIRCGVEATQDALVRSTVMVNAATNIASQMSNELTTAIRRQIEQSLRQVNSGLNLGQINVGRTVSRTMNDIENKIENIVENEIKNTVSVSSENDQILRFNARGARIRCPPNSSTLRFNQAAVVETTAHNIADTLVETIMKNKVITDIVEEVRQSTEQENAGLDLGLASGGSTTSLILLVILGVIGYMVYSSMQPGGADPTTQMVSTGVTICSCLCCCLICSLCSASLFRRNSNSQFA